jgi:hypothetical protein
MLALAVCLVSVLVASLSLRGIDSLKQFERLSHKQYLKQVILDNVVSKVLTDLQLATRYPDAEGLQYPPCHADALPSAAATNQHKYQPCDNKDKDDGYNFTLDAYLLRGVAPGYSHKLCTYPTGTPASQRPQRCSVTHLGSYSPTTKTFEYPKGAFRVSGLYYPETDPSVILTRTAAQIYSLSITFKICDPVIERSGGPLPGDQTGIENTRKKEWNAWNSAQPNCPNSKRVKVSYTGVINTNSDYFQGKTGVPAVTGSGSTSPFEGTFIGTASGTTTAASGGSAGTTTTTSPSTPGVSTTTTTTTTLPAPTPFSSGVNFTLNQSGNTIAGTWNIPGGAHGGLVNGTASGNSAHITMTHTGCSGTLTGTMTKNSDGTLTISISGSFGSSCGGAINATLTAAPN